ncbi:MAG: hypothetical protein KDA80_21750 [Planctomycetaceae bacterium]|nr:hypothetical protein [Planctomycetaceae bacterium]
MAKDKRTRDQKRKAKLAQKAKQRIKEASVAYHGEKYRTERFVPLWLEAEIGIYEVFLLSDRMLDDAKTYEALTSLVKDLRKGPLSQFAEVDNMVIDHGNLSQSVRENVIFKVRTFLDEQVGYTRDDIIGSLRSILGSMEKVSNCHAGCRDYMKHIEKFLRDEIGVSIDEISKEQFDAMQENLAMKG